MSISTLQRDAFERSPQFTKQVDDIVRETALYNANPPVGEPPSDSVRQIYSQVVRQPNAYGFAPAIVADAGWALTYDAWATDPPAARATIEPAIQKIWPLLLNLPQ